MRVRQVASDKWIRKVSEVGRQVQVRKGESEAGRHLTRGRR